MRVLITGAGLAAAHLAALLDQQGHAVALFKPSPYPAALSTIVSSDRVRQLTGDVLSLPDLIAAIHEAQATHVVHTAGLSGPGVASAPGRAYEVNVTGTVNVVQAARLTQVARTVIFSSASVYSRAAAGPVDESATLRPASLYGATKLAGEQLALAFADVYRTEVVALRYEVAYGYSASPPSSPFGQTIDALLSSAVREGSAVVQRTQPFMRPNELMYVKDMAQAAVCALTAGTLKDRVFNIGTGVLSDLTDVIAAVRMALPSAHIKLEEPLGPPAIPTDRYPFDITRATQQLGYLPRYDLASGVRDYVAAVRDASLAQER